ncbi:MAG: ABC transporter substrate-binding protein [Hyphomicrobiales bacterium]
MMALVAAMTFAATAVAARKGDSPSPGEINFVDQAGRKIMLNKVPERVAIIPPPIPPVFVSIDETTDRLVGVNRSSKMILHDGLIRKFFPNYKDIPIVGNGYMPNIESLLKVKPDLVFQWVNLGDDIITPITNAGLKVVALEGAKDRGTSLGWFRIIGRVVGNRQKAERLIAWYKAVRERIKIRTDQLADKDKLSVLYFKRFKTQFNVAGSRGFNNSDIVLAGGRNAASTIPTYYQVVDVEQILKWNPDIVFLNGFEKNLGPQDVYDNPLLADVNAVKNKRVYRVLVGAYYWDTPCQEAPLLWMWMSQCLHPELFHFDLPAEIRRAYGWIYGRTPSDRQIAHILRMP